MCVSGCDGHDGEKESRRFPLDGSAELAGQGFDSCLVFLRQERGTIELLDRTGGGMSLRSAWVEAARVGRLARQAA